MDIPEKVNLSQVVSDRIRTYIIENKLKAGDKLPSEKQLIDSLGVSRTVVREALKSLETVGLLKIKTGDGIYVDGLSLKPVLDQVSFRWMQDERSMKELWETRRVLELGAVEMAIERADAEAIEQMVYWNRQMEAAIGQKRLPIDEDLQFHRALFRATGNKTYFELSEVLTDFFTGVREKHFGDGEGTQQSWLEHNNIIRYIRDKKTAEAKREMENHLLPPLKWIMEK
ncbi:FadR/GntR family transcriptional regulator [Paenibacillus ginsengarvi]|uniref:FadR family transcriptional regulator n=1 Tax=Paenibacillus ginsengarvi TaxID=400777 RepID=A0A3B0C8F2_9BACL|nr:FadR/GntR family transcriptional regulator [Paenibacillus ginsengarvi]RKN80694.1 FadR family transcriptional regulator [Paenibacillus ginsengarvi]